MPVAEEPTAAEPLLAPAEGVPPVLATADEVAAANGISASVSGIGSIRKEPAPARRSWIR